MCNANEEIAYHTYIAFLEKVDLRHPAKWPTFACRNKLLDMVGAMNSETPKELYAPVSVVFLDWSMFILKKNTAEWGHIVTYLDKSSTCQLGYFGFSAGTTIRIHQICHSGVGKCPTWTSPNYWGYNLQLWEGDGQNPPKGTFSIIYQPLSLTSCFWSHRKITRSKCGFQISPPCGPAARLVGSTCSPPCPMCIPPFSWTTTFWIQQIYAMKHGPRESVKLWQVLTWDKSHDILFHDLSPSMKPPIVPMGPCFLTDVKPSPMPYPWSFTIFHHYETPIFSGTISSFWTTTKHHRQRQRHSGTCTPAAVRKTSMAASGDTSWADEIHWIWIFDPGDCDHASVITIFIVWWPFPSGWFTALFEPHYSDLMLMMMIQIYMYIYIYIYGI